MEGQKRIIRCQRRRIEVERDRIEDKWKICERENTEVELDRLRRRCVRHCKPHPDEHGILLRHVSEGRSGRLERHGAG